MFSGRVDHPNTQCRDVGISSSRVSVRGGEKARPTFKWGWVQTQPSSPKRFPALVIDPFPFKFEARGGLKGEPLWLSHPSRKVVLRRSSSPHPRSIESW